MWSYVLALLLYYWAIRQVLGTQVNITLDDTDSTILYEPSESWHASSEVCSTCLNPDPRDAFQNTYHDGTHAPTLPGADNTQKGGRKGGEGGGDKSGGGDVKGLQRRNTMMLPPQTRDDPNGSGSVSQFVTVQFAFNGSAVYLYCIQPLGTSTVDTTPTAMNLSFILDNNPIGHFFHSGSQSASGYLSQVNVFAHNNLTESPHVLLVDVGVGSVFLFDYMIYTQNVENVTTTTSSPSEPSPSISVDESSKRRKVGTFGGAIGGSVGVLTVLCIALAFSIIKRRRNYARRERLVQHSSPLHTNASDDSPSMFGPTPFVPRFFPGTHISSEPPPYTESPSMSSSLSPSSPDPSLSMQSSSVVLASRPHLRVVSYADIPLTSSAPAEDSPPRSFGNNNLISPLPFEKGVTKPPPGITIPEDASRRSTTFTSGQHSPNETIIADTSKWPKGSP